MEPADVEQRLRSCDKGPLGTWTVDWFSNDKLFRHELEEGHRWASTVVDRLSDSGLDAALTPLSWRTRIGDRHRFADEQDVEVRTHTGGFVLEVKSRRLVFFEAPRSYPYDTALVDTVSGWDRKRTEPLAVVLVSRTTQAMLVVPVRGTKEHWTVKRRRDRVRNIQDSFYECPRSRLVPFESLVSWLREHPG